MTTANTPTPYVPPDGVILTTMAEARRVSGQICHPLAADEADAWLSVRRVNRAVSGNTLVCWRPDAMDGDT